MYQDSLLEGIESHYTYWLVEYDLVGKRSKDIDNFCPKHYEDNIELEDGSSVCPACHTGKDDIS